MDYHFVEAISGDLRMEANGPASLNVIAKRKALAAILVMGAPICLVACQTLGFSRKPLTASLRTDSAQVAVHRSGIGYIANIGFAYTNTTDKLVSKAGCGGPYFPALEKKVKNRWVSAYAPNYLACLVDPSLVVESGETYHGTLPYRVYEPGHHTVPTVQVDSIDGLYRLRWVLSQGPRETAEGARRVESTSNEFRMVLIKR
jgi:hypothetical protein